MRIAITGGNGFLGRRVAEAILARGALVGPDGASTAIGEVLLIDAVSRSDTPTGCRQIVGDISDPGFLAEALRNAPSSIFHMAAVVSGEAEADFDKGMRVNVDATRALLDRCRAFATPPRVVFPSSLAVYGSVSDAVNDDTALWPLSSYGAQKAMGELMVNDASRKGFIDGRSFRLPTISIRPGAPNKAASSFISGILREPLNGQRAVCPVDPATKVWIASPAAAVAHLIHGHDLDAANIGYPRSLALPGLSVSVADMIGALARAGGNASLIDHTPDSAVARIVETWPATIETKRADALGFRHDLDIDGIVSEYVSEFLS